MRGFIYLIVAIVGALSVTANGSELKLFEVSDNSVLAVAFSPSGKQVACGDENGIVSVWDIESGKRIKQFQLGADVVYSICFSPDGTRIAAAGISFIKGTEQIFGAVYVWNLANDQEVFRFKDPQRGFYGVRFYNHPDVIVTCANGGPSSRRTGIVRSWNIESKATQTFSRFARTGYTSIAVGSDNPSIYLGTSLAGWRQQYNGKKGSFFGTMYSGGVSKVFDTEVSPDGKWFAYAGSAVVGRRGYVAIRPVVTKSNRTKYDVKVPHSSSYFNCISFSPDGKHIAIGTHDEAKEVVIWNFKEDTLRIAFDGHQKLVMDIAYSIDGSKLASASMDGTVRIWDANPQTGAFWQGIDVAWDGKQLWQTYQKDDSVFLQDRKASSGKLVQLDQLNRMKFANVDLTRVDATRLDELAALESLETLHLTTRSSINPGAAKLRTLPRLRKLVLDKSPTLKSSDVVAISELTNLRELTIKELVDVDPYRGTIPSETLRSISNLTQLEILDLRCGELPRGGLKYFAKLKSLRELHLPMVILTRDDTDDLSAMSKLKRVTLWSATDEVLNVLADLPNIEELSFSAAKFTDAGLKDLARLKGLKALSIRGLWLPCKATSYVRELPSMQRSEHQIYELVRLLRQLNKEAERRKSLREQAEIAGVLADAGSDVLQTIEDLTEISNILTDLRLQDHLRGADKTDRE